jgi:hypothetical protein
MWRVSDFICFLNFISRAPMLTRQRSDTDIASGNTALRGLTCVLVEQQGVDGTTCENSHGDRWTIPVVPS